MLATGAMVASMAGVAGAFPFNTAVDHAAGEDPASVVTGHFDGDGNLDVAVANNDTDDVSVLLGNGDGTLDAEVRYVSDEGPASITTEDFDEDGNLDLAVANFQDDDVSVLLGNGDGTFDAHVDYLTGLGPIWVTAADVDADDNVDLLVANENTGEVSVLLGNGDGTFDAALDHPAGASAESVVTGYFNGDGNLDLAVANASSPAGVSVLLGNGDGTFDPDVLHVAGLAPIALATEDFDGDGNADLAVANGFGSSDVSVLLGDGTGAFPSHVEYSAGDTPIAVVAANLNGDGHVDLAVANYFGDTDDVSVLLGNGDGTFQAQVTYEAGSGSSAITADLVNGDGALDLIVANQFSWDVSVLLGTPSSGDGDAPTITITTPPASPARYVLGASVLADYACEDEAGGSGVASCVGTVDDGAGIDTASVGTKSFTVDAEDNAANESTLTRTYTVGYDVLGGFPASFSKSAYQRGSTIPLKFRLGNAAGGRISDAEAQSLLSPTCRVRMTFDTVLQPGCATYDAANDVFQFSLKTSKLLQDGQHTVGLRVTAPDTTVVNTDTATVTMR